MRVKKESEKAGLKLSIQKTKIVASGPITLWQIDGEKVEIMASFTFLGSQITADGDCSHEIKRHLLLGRKAMTNLDSILKRRVQFAEPVNPKGNQPCIFIGRTDAEAETPILWPPDVKSRFVGKDADAGKD